MESSEPVRDVQTVTAEGDDLAQLPDGCSLKDIVVHTDDRGRLFELFDERWDWHPDPLVYAYMTTLRPGVTKGWGLHHKHEDRYAIIQGDMELVMYDEREGSSTCGLVSKVYLSDQHRQLINIPAGVWHADRNVGSNEVLLLNFPTIPYNHERPDKVRLPLDNDRIPHTFEDARGW